MLQSTPRTPARSPPSTAMSARPPSAPSSARLLTLEQQGGEHFFGEPALDLEDMICTDAGRARRRQRAGRRQADAEPAALRHLPAVAAVGAVRGAARGRRSRQAEARVLLRRGASAVQRRAQGAAREGRAGGAADPLQGRRRLFRHPEPARHSRTVLGQLGNRVQHALRAFTPARAEGGEAPPPRPSAPNPNFDTADAITELGVGEALVSFLDARGVPSWSSALVCPPRSRIGPDHAGGAPARSRQARSPASTTSAVDRESAYEMLQARASDRGAPTPTPATRAGATQAAASTPNDPWGAATAAVAASRRIGGATMAQPAPHRRAVVPPHPPRPRHRLPAADSVAC